MTRSSESSSSQDLSATGNAAHGQPADDERSVWPGRLLMALIVACFVIVAHGGSLRTGLWLDDHAHLIHLQKGDWSYSDAVEAAFLAIKGEVMTFWGGHEEQLRFYRPLSFTLMKLEYHLGGWRPIVMHVFSLGWHFAASMLVGALAMRCLGRRMWAIVAASMMAIHPGHIAAVHWIACQTELMATTFLLTAVLMYSRHARWGQGLSFAQADPIDQKRKPWLIGVKTSQAAGQPESANADETDSSDRAVTGWIIGAMVFFAMALGCRENAILFPLVCWSGDFLCGSGRKRRFRWEHAALLAIVVLFLIIRTVSLGGFPTPRWPYMMALNDPALPGYAARKIVIYIVALFLHVPVVPVATRELMSYYPAAFYGPYVVLVVLFFVIWRVFEWRPSLLWLIIWINLLIAPVLPVFASNHHLYLPSAGSVIIFTAILAAIDGRLRRADNPAPRWRHRLCVVLIAFHAVGFTFITLARGYMFNVSTSSEDLIAKDVIELGRPVENEDHLFFIHMPAFGYYSMAAVKNQLQLDTLYGHILMYTPFPVKMEKPARLEVLDAHRFRLHCPEDEPYLDGLGGDTAMQMMGFERVPMAPETIDADLYEVTILETTLDGAITAVEFDFEKPLTSPEYHFYFGSPEFMAYPLDMNRLVQAAATREAN